MKKTVAILVLVLAVVSIQAENLLNENFAGAFPPAGWTLHAQNPNVATWVRATDGGGSAQITAGNANASQRSMLITPAIEISNEGFYELNFQHRRQHNRGTWTIAVYVSTTDNDHESFTRLQTITPGGTGLFTAWGGWTNATISLTQFEGQTIYLAFVYEKAAATAINWQIDDVIVRPIPRTVPSRIPAVNAINVALDQTISASFNLPAREGSFESITIDPPIVGGFTTAFDGNTLTISHDGLSPSTVYTVTLADARVGQPSISWSFRTAPACGGAATVPFAENFGGIPNFTPIIFPPDCWRIHAENSAATTWVRNTAGPLMGGTSGHIRHVHTPDNVEQTSWFITEAIQLPATEYYHLSFFTRVNGMLDNHAHTSVWYSTTTNDISEFSQLGEVVMTHNDNSWSEWEEIFMSLADFQGQRIYLAFRYQSNPQGYASHQWDVARMSIEETPTYCSEPYDLDVSSITRTAALFTWSGDVDQYTLNLFVNETLFRSVHLFGGQSTHNATGLPVGTNFTWNVVAICGPISSVVWGEPFQTIPDTVILSVTAIAQGDGQNLGEAVATGNITVQNQGNILLPGGRELSATVEINGVVVGTENITSTTTGNWAVNGNRTNYVFPTLRMDLSGPGEHKVRLWINDFGTLPAGAIAFPTDTFEVTIYNQHINVDHFLSGLSIPSGAATLRNHSACEFPVTVTINNQGRYTLVDFPIHFRVNEKTPITEIIEELLPGTTRQLVVPVVLAPWENNITVFFDEALNNEGTVDTLRTSRENIVDLSIVGFSGPTSGDSLTATETVTITLENNGTFRARNVPISFLIDGENEVLDTIDFVNVRYCPSGIAGALCGIGIGWVNNHRTYTFATAADLSEFRDYRVTVRLNEPGNYIAGSIEQTRTVTNNNPNARENFPENEAIHVLRDTEVNVTFTNRNIALTQDPIAEITITFNDGEDFFTDFQVSILDNQLIFAHDGFDYKTTYTITIPEGTIVGYNHPIVWSFTTIIEAPGVFALTTPTDDAMVLLDQILTWEASERAVSYRVYFGTDPNPTEYTEVTTTSWVPYPALTYDTDYFWRVVAVNAGGETENSTGEQRFVTVFSQLTPEDGAHNILLSQELTWEASDRAVSYRVFFGTEPNPTTFTEVATTSWVPYPALTYLTTYFWRVVAVDTDGEIANTSAERSFTTIVEIPGAFALTVPKVGTPNVLLDQVLTWEASERAVSYRVYFGTEPNPTNFAEVTTTSWIPHPALTYSTEYFWRVVAINAGGETANTAGEKSFTTIVEAPGTFALTAPNLRARNVILEQELTWEASERAVSYRVYFGTAPNPTNFTEVTTTSWTPYPALTYDTEYFWRVVAVNVGGETSSEVWSFTTLPTLAVLSKTPGADADNITLAANLTVTFNRNITAVETPLVDIALYPEVPGIRVFFFGSTLTIAHGGLSRGTFYTVTIPAGMIDRYNEEITWSFTTREDAATGIEDLEAKVIVIYPNPVDDVLHIQTSELVRRIEVYNLSGQRVIATENITPSIDVSHLPSGVYVIVFITDNGIVTQRFIKR